MVFPIHPLKCATCGAKMKSMTGSFVTTTQSHRTCKNGHEHLVTSRPMTHSKLPGVKAMHQLTIQGIESKKKKKINNAFHKAATDHLI